MARTIHLCTWNVHLGLELDTVLHALGAFSDFSSLDLLALQEVSIHEGHEDADVIAGALGTTFCSFQVTAHFLGPHAQANALVWNGATVSISKQESVLLPHVRQVSLSRVESTLLCALPQQQRISIVAEGDIGQTSVRVYVAHLDVLGFAHKRAQFQRILADSRSRSPADLTILAGDLNTFHIRSRPSWNDLRGAAEADGFQDLTSEILWTHSIRQVRFRQKLDAVFVRTVKPSRCRSWTLDIPGSDHIPVFAEITLD